MQQKLLKIFISYKWADDAHNKWVEKFATDLRAKGFDAELDRWAVRLGYSFTDYMTSKITEADVFLFIITTNSVAAAESPQGQGGAVKFEMQMAKARTIAGEDMRLIGIYREGNKNVAHLRDHCYADFRDDSKYEESLKRLIDDLSGKDFYPPLHFTDEPKPTVKPIMQNRGLTPAQLRSQKAITPEPMINSIISGEWEAAATLSDPFLPRKTLNMTFVLKVVVEMITDDFGKATGAYIDDTGSYPIKYGEWRNGRHLTVLLEEEKITMTGNYKGVRLKVGLVAQKRRGEVKTSVKILDRRLLHAERELGRKIA